MLRLYLHQEMQIQVHTSINFQGWIQDLSPGLFFIQQTGKQAPNCHNIHVYLNTRIFPIQAESIHTDKKTGSRKLKWITRKKQNGFYSFCLNLLRPTEFYEDTISINIERNLGLVTRFGQIRGEKKKKSTRKGIVFYRKTIEQKAKVKNLNKELRSSGLLKEHNCGAKKDQLGRKEKLMNFKLLAKLQWTIEAGEKKRKDKRNPMSKMTLLQVAFWC